MRRGLQNEGLTLILRKASTLIPGQRPGKELIRNGFTLIEVLVSIAIIASLTILLIPNINRSLTKNNLASDAQLLSSKIESTRLLAGSTQQAEQNDTFGYYAVYLPPQTSSFFEVIRVSADPKIPTALGLPCNPNQIVNGNFPAACVVETINFSQGVTLASGSTTYRLIMFRTPSQQVYFADDGITPGVLAVTDQPGAAFQGGLKLQYSSKTATINLNNTTGQVTSTTYN